jgi:HEAT repeat protein
MSLQARLTHVFDQIRPIRDLSADQAMAAALPTADPVALAFLARALLERGQPEGLVGLIRWFHRLEETVQNLVIEQADRLDRALRETSRDGDEQAVANVIDVVQGVGPGPATYLLGEALRSKNKTIAVRAADALFAMAERAADDDGPTSPPPESVAATTPGPAEADKDAAAPPPRSNRQFLHAAVEDAVCAFGQHRQPRALRAMLALVTRPMPKAWRDLSMEHHPAVLELRRQVKAGDDAVVRRALFVLLCLPTLRGHVVAALPRVVSESGLQGPLTNWHFLLLPAVKPALARLTQVRAFVPELSDLGSWPAASLRGLATWFAALPTQPNEQSEHLASLHGCADAMARLSALRWLMARSAAGGPGSGAATDAVPRFCDDAEPAIARIALRHLRRLRWPGLTKLLAQMVNSPHAQVRQLASRKLAPIGFDRFWKAWPKLDGGQRLAAGRALIKIDPHFHSHLVAKLSDPATDVRVRALSIVSQLGQGEYVEDALISAAADPDETIASAAVIALATVKSERALTTLRWALEHPDARVRANAVEALEQLESTRHVEQLLDMAHEEQNRPRANAIKALMGMRTADAVTALSRMLDDPSPKHRISALWLVEELGLLDVARHVAEMSVGDDDRTVKARATRVIHYLIEQLKAEMAAAPRPSVAAPATAGAR